MLTSYLSESRIATVGREQEKAIEKIAHRRNYDEVLDKSDKYSTSSVWSRRDEAGTCK